MLLIEPLIERDIDAAMQLVAAAGWNQVPADWQRVIAYQPWGCFKATVDGHLAGTVTSTSYGSQLAWIGMMLVDPNMRRQGIGRALMQQAIAALRSASTQTIKLDATPVGRPLYEQLGFVAQFDFQRWRRNAGDATAHSLVSSSSELSMHDRLDELAFGVNRKSWIEKLAEVRRVMINSAGFGMVRSGRIADYLGPVVSSSAVAAEEMISQLVASSQSAILWDMPREDEALRGLAQRLGFEPVRALTRMVLGQDRTSPQLELQYAISDPATG